MSSVSTRGRTASRSNSNSRHRRRRCRRSCCKSWQRLIYTCRRRGCSPVEAVSALLLSCLCRLGVLSLNETLVPFVCLTVLRAGMFAPRGSLTSSQRRQSDPAAVEGGASLVARLNTGAACANATVAAVAAVPTSSAAAERAARRTQLKTEYSKRVAVRDAFLSASLCLALALAVSIIYVSLCDSLVQPFPVVCCLALAVCINTH